MGTKKITVIGDVGGHCEELEDALIELGMDEAFRLPDDLTVIQVGDLVHKGPDSAGVVNLVNSVMKANSFRGGWVQLAGNHEMNYIHPAQMYWKSPVDEETASVLKGWWDAGDLLVAYAFTWVNEDGVPLDILVSHAGLSPGCWEKIGSPFSAYEAAAYINTERHDPNSPIWTSGALLSGFPDRSTGVTWAEPWGELIKPWLDEPEQLPFSQVHGHAALFQWNNGVWWSQVDVPRVKKCSLVDRENRHIRVDIGGQHIWGVDPGHTKFPARTWNPLVFNGCQLSDG